jgi:copper homeostasis protein
VEAQRGGADRLEIVRDLERDGLTPSLSLVREMRREVSLPLRVMLRQHQSHTLNHPREIDEYINLIGEFKMLGVDGFVFGFLRNGQIDVQAVSALAGCLGGSRATFHRAFDDADDRIAALGTLKKCAGIDRVLTSGGHGASAEKAKRLSQYCRLSEPEITVLVGGGLNASAIRLFLQTTAVREFHTGRAVRASSQPNGKVQAALVRELAQIVHSDEPLQPNPERKA